MAKNYKKIALLNTKVHQFVTVIPRYWYKQLYMFIIQITLPSKYIDFEAKTYRKICTVEYKTSPIPKYNPSILLLVAVGSSGVLKGKQKLSVTFNSDKLGSIDFTNFSKLTMCSA